MNTASPLSTRDVVSSLLGENYTLRQTIARLTKENEFITAENEVLREAMSAAPEHQLIGTLSARFGLPPQPAHTLAILYLRRGKITSSWLLLGSMTHRMVKAEDATCNLVKVVICAIRKKTGADAIQTIHSLGYALSPEWIAKIDELITPAIAAE